MSAIREKSRINRSLLTLKLVVFFTIIGLTALHILHTTKPHLLGFLFHEYRTICIIAPFVSIIGPLIVGPLADRLAAKNPTNFGKILRILTAVCLILAAIIFACLFAVPKVEHRLAYKPHMTFSCDGNGAIIFQERCNANASCYHWERRIGSLNLTKCAYTCQNLTNYENLYTPWLDYVPSTEHSSDFSDYSEDGVSTTESLLGRRVSKAAVAEASYENTGGELLSAEDRVGGSRLARATNSASNKIYTEPPHLCTYSQNEKGENVVRNCHVYTEDTTNILVHSAIRAATDRESDTHNASWCSYPFDNFQCNIPPEQFAHMITLKNDTECKPVIQCVVSDAYESRSSAFSGTECFQIVGNVDSTIVGYSIIRILGDILPMAALTLLNTAIVIAVRETSEGRGEVCRQYAWGAIGYVLIFSTLNIFFFEKETEETASLVALILVIICFLLGAIILLVATHMPLSPPEWWWHTKTGMLVYPMSAIRRYSPEIFILTIVAILFGTFWSSIHSFLRWSFNGSFIVILSGILPALVLFFNVDKFVEYCGHSNIFIAGFAVFIIRFTALTDQNMYGLSMLMEAIEPTVIALIWITIILYMRHVMPRKFTATGQAIGILAFFGIGKGCGALIGLARGYTYPNDNAEEIYQILAAISCVIALFYFILYNLILSPNCTAKPQHIDDLMSGSASQNFSNGAGSGGGNPSAGAVLNGNGNYSPLRVYHNERGKKGQFRF